MWIRRLLILLPAFAVISCASTTITSFSDPNTPRGSIARVAVFADVDDLRLRKTIETTMVEALRARGIDAIEGSHIIMPTERPTPKAMASAFKRSGIGGYLRVFPKGAGATTAYLPPIGKPETETSGTVTVIGNTATYEERATHTVPRGYMFVKPWAEFESMLVSTSTWKTVWIASTLSKGDAGASTTTLIKSYCTKSASDLSQSGLVELGGKEGR